MHDYGVQPRHSTQTVSPRYANILPQYANITIQYANHLAITPPLAQLSTNQSAHTAREPTCRHLTRGAATYNSLGARSNRVTTIAAYRAHESLRSAHLTPKISLVLCHPRLLRAQIRNIWWFGFTSLVTLAAARRALTRPPQLKRSLYPPLNALPL